jgi:hypothetical protein
MKTTTEITICQETSVRFEACVGAIAESRALQHLAKELQRIWVEALQQQPENNIRNNKLSGPV